MTFNLHADATGNSVGNLRMFEATGAGCCLITDTSHNMADLFEPDKEVVTYSSLDECMDKVKYLTENPEYCSQIAAAGYKKTLEQHTVERRVIKIHEFILSNI